MKTTTLIGMVDGKHKEVTFIDGDYNINLANAKKELPEAELIIHWEDKKINTI